MPWTVVCIKQACQGWRPVTSVNWSASSNCVVCAGMWTDKIHRVGEWNTAPSPCHLQRPTWCPFSCVFGSWISLLAVSFGTERGLHGFKNTPGFMFLLLQAPTLLLWPLTSFSGRQVDRNVPTGTGEASAQIHLYSKSEYDPVFVSGPESILPWYMVSYINISWGNHTS